MPQPAAQSAEGLGRLLRLAGPIVFAQLCFFGMNTTDTIVAGRMSAQVLAGVALGGTIMMIGLTFLFGFALAVSPLVAHRVGARAPACEIAQLNRSALVLLSVLWSAHGLLMWLLPPLILAYLPIESEVRVNATEYLRMLVLGSPAMGVFFALRNVMEGLGYSKPVMWLGMFAFLINIPLDVVLMTGWGVVPALGAAGCGLATAMVQLMMALGLCWLFLSDARFQPYRPQGKLSLAAIAEILRLGAPIALAMASEHALFAAGGLLMARFGTETLGAAQIALNFTGMMFMIAIGMGQASSVLVGQAMGRGDFAGVRMYGRLGYSCMFALSALIAIVMLSQARVIAAWYSSDAQVLAVAVSLIYIAGFFHMVDAFQALGSGLLRGLKDTRYVMFATLLAYWGVGGSSFVCLFVFNPQIASAAAVWWVYCAALACAAALLGGRFYWQLRKLDFYA